MKSDRPETLSEALKLKRWSVVCHPADKSRVGEFSKDLKEMADGMRRVGTPVPRGKLPVVISDLIPVGSIMIVGPATDTDELDARWETLKELGL